MCMDTSMDSKELFQNDLIVHTRVYIYIWCTLHVYPFEIVEPPPPSFQTHVYNGRYVGTLQCTSTVKFYRSMHGRGLE